MSDSANIDTSLMKAIKKCDLVERLIFKKNPTPAARKSIAKKPIVKRQDICMLEYEFELIEELSSGAGYQFQRLRREDGKSFVACTSLAPLASETKNTELEKVLSFMQGLSHLPGFLDYEGISNFHAKPWLLIEDKSLFSLNALQRKQSIAPRQALGLAQQLCKSLIAIHERRQIAHVIHPSYLFCTTQFSQLHVSLLPQSLPMARYYLKWQGFSALRQLYPDTSYISPEMTGLTEHPLDYRSDFFVLGILLFEWLSGKHPFRVPGELNYLKSLLESEPPRVNQIRKDVSNATGELILRLLAKSPSERFDNAKEVESAIKFCLEEKNKKNNITNLKFQKYKRPILLLDIQSTNRKNIQKKFQNVFHKAINGSSEICLLHGELSSGKSQFLKSLRWQFLKEACLFLKASPSPKPKGQAYDLIGNLLHSLATYLKQLSLEAPQRKGLEVESLQNWQQEFQNATADYSALCELCPDLQILFPGLSLSPKQHLDIWPLPKENIHFVILSFLQKLAKKERPFVFCLENLENADTASLEILEGFFQTPLPYSLGILSWSSNQELPPLLSQTIHSIKSNSGLNIEELEIPALSQAECKHLLCKAIGQEEKEAAPFLSFLWNRSKGNPGKLKNTLEALLQEKLLSFREERWHWFLDNFRTTLIPQDIEPLWRKRLETLSIDEKGFLGVLSNVSEALPLGIVKSLQGTPKNGSTRRQDSSESARRAPSNMKTPPKRTIFRGALQAKNSIKNPTEEISLKLEELGFIKLSLEAHTNLLHVSIASKVIGNILFPEFCEHSFFKESLQNKFWKDGDLNRLLLRCKDSCLDADLEQLITNTKKAIRWGEAKLAKSLFKIICKHLHQNKSQVPLHSQRNLLEMGALLAIPESIPEEIIKNSSHQLKELIRTKISLRIALQNNAFSAKLSHQQRDLAKKGIRKSGIQLRYKYLGLFSISVRRSLIRILKKHHSVLQNKSSDLLQAEIQETQKILYYYAKLVSDRKYTAALKQLELALRYDAWEFPVDVAIAQLIANLSSEPKAERELVSLYKLLSSLELSKEARSILCRQGRIWTDSYDKWKVCLDDAYAKSLSVAQPMLASVIKGDRIFIQIFHEGISMRELSKKAKCFLEESQAQNLEESKALALKYLDFAQTLGEGLENKGQEMLPDFYSPEVQFRIHTLHLALALHTGETHFADFSVDWLSQQNTSQLPAVWALPVDFYLSLYWLWNYSSAGKRERIEIRKRLALQFARLKRNSEELAQNPYRLLFLEAVLQNLDLGASKTRPPSLDLAIESARKGGLDMEAGLICRFIGIYYLGKGQEPIAQSYLKQASKDYAKASALAIAKDLADKYPEWIHIDTLEKQEEKDFVAASNLGTQKKPHTFPFSFSPLLSLKQLPVSISESLLEESQADKIVIFLSPTQNAPPTFACLQERKKRPITKVDYPERHCPMSLVDSVRRSALPISIETKQEPQHLFSADPYLGSKDIQSLYSFAVQEGDASLAVFYFENPKNRDFFASTSIESIAIHIRNSLKHEFLKQRIAEKEKHLQNKNALYEQSLAEKRALVEELKQAQQKKSVFLAGISERIRKPMDQIERIAAHLSSIEKEASKEGLLRKLSMESKELRKVISSILEFAQITEEEAMPEPSAFDLSNCIEEALEDYIGLAAEKGVEVIYEIAPSVPRRVIGEESQLKQILDKLLRNAVQYTKEGEIHLAVDASQDDILHRIRFRLRDTGKGITPEKAQELFAKHRQARIEETQAGLGLLITQRLCQLMGGDIQVASEVGKGSIFEFYIKTLGVVTPAETHPHAEILADKRFLLVDDNITVRRILRHHLRIWRTFPMAAISGKAALELFSDPGKRFSAAIIDMEMPNMTGARLIERIQEQARFANMVFVLFINPLDDPKRYEYLQNDKYIVEILKKPVNVSELQKILIESLRTARDRLDRHKQGTVAQSLSAKRFD